MPPSHTPKKVANSLVAMSSAAILAVYAAGYDRTRAAARKLEAQSAARLPAAIEMVKPPVSVATPAVSPSPKAAPRRPPVTAVAQVRSDAPAHVEAPEPPAAVPTPMAAPAVAETLPPVVAPAAPPAPTPPPAAPTWKDGTYYGWGTSRHGNIQAAVTIESGRILSATIAQCQTRYSCNVIDRLPPEVPQRQSPEVDYVSGATQSANAFYYAVVEALSKAK
jgi:uncharacterized protein with FMN-binding domain